MPIISEKSIQNDILDYLAATRIGYFWQNDSVGIKGRKRQNRFRPNGVADILGCVGGQFIAIEVKSKTGVHTNEQKIFGEKLKSCGGLYLLARSLEDVVLFLQRNHLI